MDKRTEYKLADAAWAALHETLATLTDLGLTGAAYEVVSQAERAAWDRRNAAFTAYHQDALKALHQVFV